MPALGRPPTSSPKPEGEVLSVARLLNAVRRQLEGEYDAIWVEGEISEAFVARSGHLYLTLRDQKEEASLKAVMWSSDARRLRFEPKVGALVRAQGTLTLYPPRGAFQMRIVRLVESGAGDLQRRFEEALARLAKQGLLDPERKRPLPATPRRIGVVTSRDGAALRDILKVLRDRLPIQVVLCHATVQGDGAPDSIISALQRISTQEVEAVIVGRGGGSADDLSAWNDERVALAVASCPVPVISAVGHETDVSLVDLVADVRAATPSEAAMLAAPSRADLLSGLSQLDARLRQSARVDLRHRRTLLKALGAGLPDGIRLLDARRQKLDELSRDAEASVQSRLRAERRRRDQLDHRLSRRHPVAELERSRSRVERLSSRLEQRARADLDRRRSRLGRAAASLQALSPLLVLGRGYALVRRADDGALVTDASTVEVGDRVDVRLDRGGLRCEVSETSGD